MMFLPNGRPLSLVVAIGLLVLIGLSGLAAGLTVIQTMSGATPVPPAGVTIGAGIAAYGFAAAVAGIGLFRGRRAAWWAGVLIIGVGLVVQIALLLVARLDSVSAVGLAIWGLTLACLLVPASRRSVGV